MFFLHTKDMKKYDANKRSNKLKKFLNNNTDVIVRPISFGRKNASLVFVDEVADIEQINLNIIKPLNNSEGLANSQAQKILEEVVSFGNAEVLKEEDVVTNVLKGFAILFVDDIANVLGFNVIKYEGRGVEEPPTSTVISGPREGFTESIKTNIGLIRKRLISPKLKIEDLTIGERTKTSVKVVYFSDLADERVIKKLREKLDKIKIDGVLDSYYIGLFLEEKPNSMFRQIGSSEKPDIVCAKLLEGRVAIFVDGSPIVLTVPFIFMEDFQSANDYYSDNHRATMLRILRILAFAISIYLPGMYIALQLFHYKVLPLKFLITIISTTQNLPLNPFLEIFFIIILFDILFEASLRMPKYLGIAVSIVGALILGDTAVKAGLVSPPGVMIVAMSAITIYIIPNQSAQISMLRLAFAFIGGTLGFHGIILGSMFLVAYLANMDSYLTSYLAPYAPFVSSDQKDALVKLNLLAMKSNPKSYPNHHKTKINFENSNAKSDSDLKNITKDNQEKVFKKERDKKNKFKDDGVEKKETKKEISVGGGDK